ncbi:phosphatidylserine decarboxylase 1 [Rachicladosporium monterosium]|uniref:phosphatidylserine decarboxylase n=1 Tax=Rachicladosporium monterosium TaxID=1507873 RepID=A0ABR0L767_9PEZI|nr:phosphatidylserine decarboxylase 1 [Rachicladosporium monterosium]
MAARCPQRILAHISYRPRASPPPPPHHHRPFHSSPHHRKESFASRARTAWSSTRTVWRPIPIAVGVAFLGGFQLYRIQARERRKEDEEWRNRAEHPEEYETTGLRPKRRKRIVPTLYYCVVYLAPGDYHRFHSPASWVVQSRRHFAGELYSVSPYLVRSLPGLFTLNERVVLLGKWKYGFFSYTPVGATNVGSIIVNFDRELRTNSLLTDTAADRAAEKAQEAGQPYSGFAEATYGGASQVLGGHALVKGEEMGGFQLGSTIVMVFEAPKGRRPTLDEGWVVGGAEEEVRRGRKGGWRWCIEKGMTVKVGERLGFVEGEE